MKNTEILKVGVSEQSMKIRLHIVLSLSNIPVKSKLASTSALI